MRPAAAPPMSLAVFALGLTLWALSPVQAQGTPQAAQAQVPPTEAQQQAADAAASKAMYAACGAVEAAPLPIGVRPGVYRGKLGQQTVTLELAARRNEDTQVQDRYSYDRYGIDVNLARGRAANRTAGYVLTEVEAVTEDGDEDARVRGCLDLSADGDTLKGQWHTPDGSRRLALTLRPVNVAAQPLALPASPGLTALRAKDPYTFLKVNRPWVAIRGGVREPLSGVTYPRVAGGTAALNAALQDHQLSLVSDALDCLSDFGNRDNRTDYEGEGMLSWRSAHLVSLHEEVGLYCGGAHPDNYTAGVTLDARTGRNVKLGGGPGTLWPGLNAHKIQALYLAGYPEDTDDAEEADCLDSVSSPDISSGYDNYTLYLTGDGLALWPTYLPHVAGACAEVVTVPYAELRPLADARSPYFRDLYPR